MSNPFRISGSATGCPPIQAVTIPVDFNSILSGAAGAIAAAPGARRRITTPGGVKRELRDEVVAK